MAYFPERRNPPGRAGFAGAFAGSGMQGDLTAILTRAHDVSRNLALLAEQHRTLAPHELEWALWGLFDGAREVAADLRREVLR